MCALLESLFKPIDVHGLVAEKTTTNFQVRGRDGDEGQGLVSSSKHENRDELERFPTEQVSVVVEIAEPWSVSHVWPRFILSRWAFQMGVYFSPQRVAFRIKIPRHKESPVYALVIEAGE